MIASLALVACDSGGDGSDPEPPQQRDIVGLWDSSFEDGGLEEVTYFEIKPDLSLAYYDYRGDTADQGPNCYFFSDGDARLVPLGGDLYETVSSDDSETGESIWRRQGDSLVNSIVSDTDRDGDGAPDVFEIERWPAAVGLSSTDFNRC